MKIQFENRGITVFESSLYRTTSTIIGLDDVVLIIDPNWLPSEIGYILHYLKVHHNHKKQYLIFTHSDYDHIIGYEAFKDAITIASINFTLNPDTEKVLNQISDFDIEYYITRDYPISYPSVDMIITSCVQVLHLDNTNVYFYHTLGHTNDGIFMVIPEKKVWVAGDYLSNIEIPWIGDSASDYKTTLALAEFIYHKYPEIDTLIPGHGDTTESRSEILDRIQNDIHYLDMVQTSTENKNNPISDSLKQHLNKYAFKNEMEKIHMQNMQKLGD